MLRRSFFLRGGLFGLGLGLISCGGGGGQRSRIEAPAVESRGSKAERGHVVGSFGEGAFGPRLTGEGRDRLAYWLVPGERSGGLFAAPLSHGGTLGRAVQLAESPPKPLFLAPGARLGNDTLILVGRGSSSDSALEVFVVSDEAALVRADRIFALGKQIGWAAASGGDDLSVVFWSDRRELGTRLSARGVLSDRSLDALTLSDSALVWQVRPCQGGGCIAFVEDQGDDVELLIVRVTEKGAERITLARMSGKVDGLDFVLHDSGGHIVFTERDTRTNVARLFGLPLSRDLAPAGAPEPLTPRRGNQRIRDLLSAGSAASVRVVWDEDSLNPLSGSRTYFGKFDERGALEPLGFLESAESDPVLPEFTLRGDQLTVLARVRSNVPRGPKSELAVLALGASGAEAFPVTVPGVLEPATLAWDLSCAEDLCRFLAARPAKEFYTAFWVEPRGTGRPSAAVTLGHEALPRLVADEPIKSLPSLTNFDVARISGDQAARSDELVLSLTYFDPGLPIVALKKPARDGKMTPEQAFLTPTRVAGLGDALLGPMVHSEAEISLRARSPGGVSLSSFQEGRALVGWAAFDQGKPHVFVTLVDQAGKRVRQQMLTKIGAEVTDVSVARTSDGFVVLWIDDRSGTPEVYGVVLDRELRAVTSEQRLTEGALEPSDLEVEVVGDEVLFAYSARTEEGRLSHAGGIFVGAFDGRTGVPRAQPMLVRRSGYHAFSPRFLRGSGLAWLETPTDNEGEPAKGRAMLAKFDRLGMRLIAPRDLAAPGHAMGLATDCDDRSCSLAVLTKDPDDQRVYALLVPSLDRVSDPAIALEEMFKVTDLLHEGASPILVGSALYYATADGREGPTIRRAELRFPGKAP